MNKVDYDSPIGNINTTFCACDETYLQVAERLGVPLNSKPIVCVRDGVPVLRKEWANPIGLKGGNIQFVIVPRGRTVKNIFRIVATIALSVFAPYAAGLLGFTAGTLAYGLVSAGIVLGGTFLLNALMGPTLPNLGGNQSQAQASPTYSIGAQGNRARLLNPIPRTYGTHIIYPDFASQPYQSFENNEQYLYQLFCLGVGEYRVDKINIDKTELWNSTSGLSESFSDVELEIIPPGALVTLFPSNVVTSSEVSGQELRNELIADFTTTSGNRMTFNISQVAIEYLSPGDVLNINNAVNSGLFTITDKATTEPYTWIEFNTTFTPVTTPTETFITLDNWLGPFVANPNNQGTDLLKIDVALPRGLYYANDDGGLSNASVTYEVQTRPIDNLGNPIGPYVSLLTETITNSTNTPQRFTKSFNVSFGRYEVRLRRTTTKFHDARYGNDIVWAGLRAFIPDDNIYEDVTLLAIKIRASNQLSNQSSTQINVIQSGKIPVWNGTTWSAPVVTSNPSWIVADILRNPIYGAGLPDSRVDLAKLLELSSIYNLRGDSFNGVFDTSKTLWESLGSVMQAVRSQPILVAGVISFVRDQQKALARTVITPQSVLKNSFSSTHILQGEDSADDVIVEFMDSSTWETSEVQATLPGSSSNKPARIQMFGVTNLSQAWREGMYYAASNKYRRILASVTTAADGRLLLKGDPVIVSHDVPQWNQNGFIDDFNPDDLVFTMDRSISFDSDSDNFIILRRRDGKEFGPLLATPTEYSNQCSVNSGDLEALELAQGLSIEDVLSLDDEAKRTTYVFYSTSKYVKRFLVTNSTMRGLEEVELSLVIDDERVYTADTGTPPPGVDYLGPGVTPSGPSVDSLTAVLDPFSGADPVLLMASWSVTGGATNYILQSSSNGTIWTTIYTGTDTHTNIVVNAGTVYLRVAAIGTTVGPWKMFSGVFGTPALLPGIISGLNTLVSIEAGIIEVSFNAAPRATSYLIEVYSESVPGSGNFNSLELSKTTTATFISWTSTEVTAAGGPWSRLRVAVTASNVNGNSLPVTKDILDIELSDVTGLSLLGFYNGTEAQIQWNPVYGATAYTVKIYNDSNTLVRTTDVTTNGYYYTNASLLEDGGPWRSFSVKVNAKSDLLTGPESTITITDAAPPAPSNITSSSPSAGRLDITWNQVMLPDVVGYVLYASTTNNFVPDDSNKVFEGNTTGVSTTGLAAGTYYFRLMTKDTYVGNNGYIYSNQYSQVVG